MHPIVRREQVQGVFIFVQQSSEHLVVWCNAQGNPHAITSLLKVAQMRMAKAHSLPGPEMVWLKRHNLPRIEQRLRKPAHLPVQRRATVPAFWKGRVLLNQLRQEP